MFSSRGRIAAGGGREAEDCGAVATGRLSNRDDQIGILFGFRIGTPNLQGRIPETYDGPHGKNHSFPIGLVLDRHSNMSVQLYGHDGHLNSHD